MNRSSITKPVSDFRFIDQLTVAVDRGVPDPLARAPNASLENLGALIEAAVLCQTNSLLAPLVNRSKDRGLVKSLTAAQESPLEIAIGSLAAKSWGFMALCETTVQELRDRLYVFQLAARKAMCFRGQASKAKAKLCGAIGEMVDNIIDHSNAVSSGVVAFCGEEQRFEVSVGDAGIGVLASLRTNPKFSYLQDSGTAMSVAIQDGNSRYGPLQDRGYGFGTLFRALTTLDASIRFRSGDYALESSGRSPTERTAKASQKGTLNGFVISVRLDL